MKLYPIFVTLGLLAVACFVAGFFIPLAVVPVIGEVRISGLSFCGPMVLSCIVGFIFIGIIASLWEKTWRIVTTLTGIAGGMLLTVIFAGSRWLQDQMELVEQMGGGLDGSGVTVAGGFWSLVTGGTLLFSLIVLGCSRSPRK